MTDSKALHPCRNQSGCPLTICLIAVGGNRMCPEETHAEEPVRHHSTFTGYGIWWNPYALCEVNITSFSINTNLMPPQPHPLALAACPGGKEERLEAFCETGDFMSHGIKDGGYSSQTTARLLQDSVDWIVVMTWTGVYWVLWLEWFYMFCILKNWQTVKQPQALVI